MAGPVHLALPIRVINGTYAVDEQDSQAEAITQVKVICLFPRGSRQESMDFGIDDPSFQIIPIDTMDIAKAISDYAPDLDTEINVVSDPMTGTEQVNIKVSMPYADDTDEVTV